MPTGGLAAVACTIPEPTGVNLGWLRRAAPEFVKQRLEAAHAKVIWVPKSPLLTTFCSQSPGTLSLRWDWQYLKGFEMALESFFHCPDE